MVRLCVDSLAWVERIRHENVGLVLHVPLLGDADPADIAREAGKHLAALRIRCPSLPEEKMRKLLAQLTAQGYRGAAALEPAPGTGFSSWREGKAVLEELLASDGR